MKEHIKTMLPSCLVSMARGFFSAKLYPHLACGRGGIIEFTGPPGVGKSYLIRQLVKQCETRKVKNAFMREVDLDIFRRHLLHEKTEYAPRLAERELRRLTRDQFFCRNENNKAVVLDEHLAQHQSREISRALVREIDGYDEFLDKRLVIIMVDDPVAIMERVRYRLEKENHVWSGHRNKSKQEIVDISQQLMESRVRMHDLICNKGGHSLILDARDGLDVMIKRIMAECLKKNKPRFV